MAGHGVDLVEVKGLAADLDVLHAVLAVNGGEVTLSVRLDGAGDGGVDGVGQAGDVGEAAGEAGVGGSAHLEAVEYLLAGGLDHGGHIAEGHDVEDVLDGDVARGDVGADAAAVHEADVGAHDDAVGVGHEVAEVGLAVADGPAAVVIRGHELDLALRDDLAGVVLVFGLDAGGEVGYGLIGAVDLVHEAGGDGAGRGVDDDLADVGELGAGLVEDDVLTGLVLDGLAVDDAVAVAVDEHVDAGGVGYQVAAGEFAAGRVDAHVADGDNIVRALGDGGVN